MWPSPPKKQKIKRAKAKKKAVSRFTKSVSRKHIVAENQVIPLPSPRPSHPFAWLAVGNQPIDIEAAPDIRDVVRLPLNIFKAFAEFMVKPVGRCQEFETVDKRIKTVVNDAAHHFGKPAHALSCYRSAAYNRSVGGAHRSQHIQRKALDFRIPGVDKRALARYVRNHPIMRKIGGVGVYKSDFIHADVGPKRNWDWTTNRRRWHHV